MSQSVKYTKIVVEGFQSIAKPVTFILDRGSGITLLKGRNGVGKTTLLNALYWAEYCENMKNSVATWKDRRTEGYRGTRVAVYRTIGEFDYLIARHKDFKGLTLGMTGGDTLMIFQKPAGEGKFEKEHLISAEYIKVGNSAIVEQLGVNSTVFINSIMFGQKMKKLIESDNKDKREVFEELFDLAFIEGAKTKAQNKLKELQDDLTVKLREQVALNTRIEKDSENIEQRNTDYTEWLVGKRNDIALLEDQLAVLDSAISLHPGQLKEAEDLVKSWEKKVKDNQELFDSYSKKVEEETACVNNYRTANENANDCFDAVVQACKDLKQSRITDHQEKLDSLLETFEDVKQKRNSEIRIESDYRKLIQKNNERIEKLSEPITESCPTCGGDLDKAKIAEAKKNAKEEVSGLKKANKGLEENINTVLKKLEEYAYQEADLLNQINHGEDILTELKEVDLKALIPEVDKKLVSSLQKADTLKKAAEESLNKAKQEVVDSGEAKTLLKELEDNLTEAKDYLTKLKVRQENSVNEFNERTQQVEKEKPLLLEENRPEYFKVDKLQESLDQDTKSRDELAQVLSVIQSKCERLDWWIKKGFGANGLKAYVFESMLNTLNAYCASYYSFLRFRVEFSIDLTKSNKPFTTLIYSEDQVREYGDLSGGQKQRVDICIAFAMHDLITEKRSFNILVLDEIFEGLDTEGIETAFELIRKKAENASVYLVSHNEIIDSLYCRSLYVTADEDGSTIINENGK